MLSYCLESPYQWEKNFIEDKNLFITDFIVDASVDYENSVAIRSTVIDFIEEAAANGEFNKQILESVIKMFASDRFSLNNANLPHSR